jgi:mannosyltransferase
MAEHDYQAILLVVVLLITSVLRLYHLGQSSLWYDEVVTMRLAKTESPSSLLQLLGQIDATRAPLHPLVLQGWVKLFGPSDYSGRAFSVLCGIITVGLVYWIGLQAFNASTGLWAAWLCALSPLLVYYSREARMYTWLTLVTCLAWGLLFSYARSPRPWRLVLYGFSLVALMYSHPLGLLMVSALGLVSIVFRQAFQMSWRGWFSIHFAVAISIAPWLSHYLDHIPESTSGLLPLQYLLGIPIGFIGGNFWALSVYGLLITYGLCRVERQRHGWIQVALSEAQSISLLIWFVVPPLLLYAYSRGLHPIFGPARYTLFVGPAYLLLVARGLSKLPWSLGIMTAVAGAVLSGIMLLDDVYRSDRYADWRSAAAYLDRREPKAVVAVVTGTVFGSTELETARYYFGPGRVVIPWIDPPDKLMTHQEGPLWVSTNLQDGHPTGQLPDVLATRKFVQEVVDFSRLRLMKVDFHQTSASGD